MTSLTTALERALAFDYERTAINEHARLASLLAALVKVAVAADEHVSIEPGMYSSECVGLGGADEIITALSELKAVAGET